MGPNVVWLCLTSMFVAIDTLYGQCPIGTTMSFEKISSVTVRGVPLLPLYTGPADMPVTAECNNRCRAGPKCRAFLVNYEKHVCTGFDYDSQSRGASILSTPERTSYFEKICLSQPPCEKAWTFERVLGRELAAFDDRVLSGVASRLRCQELCLKERAFACRSGEYDYAQQTCRLSAEDRRSQPNAYRVAIATVDYFENQCAPVVVTAPACDFDKFDDVDLRRADLVRTAFSADQCRQLCDATRAFVCRSFTWAQPSAQCWLSSDDMTAVGGVRGLQTHAGAVYHERSACLDLQLYCNHDSMTVSLNTLEPFSGKLYSKDEPNACESLGRSTTNTLLTLPFSPRDACGVRHDSGGKYSSLVVVQHHPLIQRKGDRIVQLTCHFQTVNRTVSNSYSVVAVSPPVAETAIVNATAPSPNIRLRITDGSGGDITGARLGDELYLRIELDDDSVFGIFARDLMAKSGKTDESITLIDANGCPTDTNIFPALEKVSGSKALQGKFDAFKFADDVVVRFQVHVQFCVQECTAVHCQHFSNRSAGAHSFGRRKRHANETTATTPMPGVTPPLLSPDYALQREIIIEGISVKSSRQPFSRTSNEMDYMSMFCTSKTTLMAALVTIVTLQITILGSCCACLLIYKRAHNCCPQLLDDNLNNNGKETAATDGSDVSSGLYSGRTAAGRQATALWSASMMARID